MEGIIRGSDLLAVIVKHLPFARKAELLFAALDEQRFEESLQRGNLLADGGLGDAVQLGGF